MVEVVKATVLALHKFRLVSNLSTGLLESDGLQKGTKLCAFVCLWYVTETTLMRDCCKQVEANCASVVRMHVKQYQIEGNKVNPNSN